jgi:hypothetical protein
MSDMHATATTRRTPQPPITFWILLAATTSSGFFNEGGWPGELEGNLRKRERARSHRRSAAPRSREDNCPPAERHTAKPLDRDEIYPLHTRATVVKPLPGNPMILHRLTRDDPFSALSTAREAFETDRKVVKWERVS